MVEPRIVAPICTQCGEPIERDNYAIRVGDLVITDKKWVHENCALYWLEQKCLTQYVDENAECVNWKCRECTREYETKEEAEECCKEEEGE